MSDKTRFLERKISKEAEDYFDSEPSEEAIMRFYFEMELKGIFLWLENERRVE